LAIRLYRADGWQEYHLIEYVAPGPARFKFFDEGWRVQGIDLSYWVPEPGTNLNIEKLLQAGIKVHRTFDDQAEESDLEHLRRFNW
jgi:hypothetical protein